MVQNAEPAVACSHDANNALPDGVIDRLRNRVIGITWTTEAHVNHIDAIIGEWILIRVDGSFNSCDDPRILTVAFRIQDLECHEFRSWSNAL
jgi:hypothetical protein